MSNYHYHSNQHQNNQYNPMADQNQHIQSISYSKLAEYDQTRIDLPMRKYVLITNLLREPSSSIESEQHWFDTCLDELDKEEERERQLEQEQEQAQAQAQAQEQAQEQAQKQEQKQLNKSKFHRRKPDLHVHTFYNYRNGSGFLVCTSFM